MERGKEEEEEGGGAKTAATAQAAMDLPALGCDDAGGAAAFIFEEDHIYI